MPLYQYRCDTCHKDFDMRVKMDERGHKQNCPSCGNKSTRHEVSKFAALVPGGGMDFSGMDCAGGACDSGPSMGGHCCGGGSCAH